MGRRNDNKLTVSQEEAADRTMRALLQRHDHPTAPASPPDLASRIAQRLPPVPPAIALRVERRHSLRRRIGTWTSVALVLLFSSLGAWGVLIDSTLPAVLFGGPETNLGHAALVVTLAAKPIIVLIMSLDPTIVLTGAIATLAAGWLWWRLLTSPTTLVGTENRL